LFATAYKSLRRGLGYVSIRESSVLASAIGLAAGAPPVEVVAIEQALLGAQSSYGRAIRFTQTRQGQIGQVRLDPRLAEELIDD